ncbi:MAG: phosphoribosylamine--glycine ligase [Coriobacteriia bacterium]|nr:phosphoribosylamine--glycine ligase [Coriobacteriia bacterium]
MNILVIGSGGREHAITCGLAASPQVETIYVAPGNGGTALQEKAVNVDLSLLADDESIEAEELDLHSDASAELRFALMNDIQLVVVGPEDPLVAGLADELRAAGIAVFGPSMAGAQLEGSKQFSKDFMFENGIPTAAYAVYAADEREAAYACLEDFGAPVVVKADGLAAGKGVTVAATLEEARNAVDECFDGRFGDSGTTVVIEACLRGDECSMIAFVDGTTVLPLAPSQDHKRVGEGDQGPNTGGMGAYSPVPSVTDEQLAQMTDILQHTADALAQADIDYRGILYAGFMLTAEGPQVLEYNVRFGDPETQVLLPRLKTDLASVMLKTARGELAGTSLEFTDAVGVTVVIASKGYPAAVETGFPITGFEQAQHSSDDATIKVYHAGTKLQEDAHGLAEVVTAGGRVINVTALAPTFEQAIAAAYRSVEQIEFEGAFYRQDIATRAHQTSNLGVV